MRSGGGRMDDTGKFFVRRLVAQQRAFDAQPRDLLHLRRVALAIIPNVKQPAKKI